MVSREQNRNFFRHDRYNQAHGDLEHWLKMRRRMQLKAKERQKTSDLSEQPADYISIEDDDLSPRSSTGIMTPTETSSDIGSIISDDTTHGQKRLPELTKRKVERYKSYALGFAKTMDIVLDRCNAADMSVNVVASLVRAKCDLLLRRLEQDTYTSEHVQTHHECRTSLRKVSQDDDDDWDKTSNGSRDEALEAIIDDFGAMRKASPNDLCLEITQEEVTKLVFLWVDVSMCSGIKRK